MALVIAGWLITKAIASSIRLIPVCSASWARSSTASSLRWFAGADMSKRADGLALEVGDEAASLRQRPESQPPDSGL